MGPRHQKVASSASTSALVPDVGGVGGHGGLGGGGWGGGGTLTVPVGGFAGYLGLTGVQSFELHVLTFTIGVSCSSEQILPTLMHHHSSPVLQFIHSLDLCLRGRKIGLKPACLTQT